MAIYSYFFNAVKGSDGTYDRTYNAENITEYLDLLVGNGVFPNPSTNLQVVANGTMGCIVQAGSGWINGHKLVNTADMILTLSASDVILSRIDAVVFYVDHANRTMGIKVKEGTKATNPTAPTMSRSESLYEMCLAQITINKQATTITQANIRDTRGLSDLCGWVQGLVQQANTQTLFAQWNTAYDEAIKADTSAFNTWFAGVKENLSTSTLIRTYKRTYTTTETNEKTFTIGIPEFVSGLDILEIYVNGMRLTSEEYTLTNDTTVTFTNTIDVIGTEIEFVIYKSVDGSNAETVVEEVEALQETVNVIKQYQYVGTGTDDNKKLSQIIQDFLNGGDDYKQMEIDVIGSLGVSTPYSGDGSASRPYLWFALGQGTSTSRRVRLNFGKCDRIVIDTSSYGNVVVFGGNDIFIKNVQAVLNNATDAIVFNGERVTCDDSMFWINGKTGATGTISGGSCCGTFTNTRMSVTGSYHTAYGFTCNGNTLRLNNCEILAYTSTSTTNEAVAVHVKGDKTNNVLVMNGCSCPIASRNGFKQNDTVKVNSGYYCLVGNALGKAANVYATGEGKTETGTMIISK